VTRPEVKEAEFDFFITYELNGEKKRFRLFTCANMMARLGRLKAATIREMGKTTLKLTMRATITAQ
jgi:hypothetical protein